ncbi:hypothetical protein D3C71_1179650 [compost metagenome]
MDDQLRAAGLVEKPLHQQRILRRQGSEGQACRGQVFHQLFGAGEVQAEGFGQPVETRLQIARRSAQQLIEVRLQTGHGQGQFGTAPRRFAEPEGNRRRLALGIFDPHLAGLHPQDSIGRIAQLKDIPGDAFYRKVFVDAADVQRLGLKQYDVVGVVRDGPAAGHRRQFRATAPAQAAGHGVAVQVGAADALTAVVALGEHLQQRLIVFFVEFGVGRGTAQHVQQRLLLPFLAADFGDDLLRENVQRRHGDQQRIEFASAHAVEQRGAFDQVVAGGGEQATLGRAADLVPGAADPLQESGNRTWRGDLTHQVDVADVDAQFQRCGGDQHLQLAALEPLFGVEAKLLGQAAMVGGYCVFAEAFAQVPAQAFGQASGVDENQCGAVFAGEGGEAVVDQLPDIIGHHRR